jgi:hypothetical protein
VGRFSSGPDSAGFNKLNSDVGHKEQFVDAAKAAEYLCCSRKHVLKLSISGKIPAHPLPGSSQRKTWRYLLTELRDWMLNSPSTELGRKQGMAVRSPAGGSRKGGQ